MATVSNPDVTIYSTGGTFKAIADILGDKAEQNLVSVSDYTGQPEMQGGLVKTLDFKIYLGLLSETYNEAHKEDLARVDGVQHDMVVVNLYPFKQTVAQDGVTPEMARTNIDIGGPCMVRASASTMKKAAAPVDSLSTNSGTPHSARRRPSRLARVPTKTTRSIVGRTFGTGARTNAGRLSQGHGRGPEGANAAFIASNFCFASGSAAAASRAPPPEIQSALTLESSSCRALTIPAAMVV